MPLGDSVHFGYGVPGGYRPELLTDLQTRVTRSLFAGKSTDNSSSPLDGTARPIKKAITATGSTGFRPTLTEAMAQLGITAGSLVSAAGERLMSCSCSLAAMTFARLSDFHDGHELDV